jgi:hypothetical protein
MLVNWWCKIDVLNVRDLGFVRLGIMSFVLVPRPNWSQGSIVSIVTVLWAGRFGVRISVGARGFSLLQKRPDQVWVPPSVLFSGYQGSFPIVKWLRHEVNHSPPSNAEVKNEWIYTSTPPYMPSWRGQGIFAIAFTAKCLDNMFCERLKSWFWCRLWWQFYLISDAELFMRIYCWQPSSQCSRTW